MDAQVALGLANNWIAREIEGGLIVEDVEPQQNTETGEWYFMPGKQSPSGYLPLFETPMVVVNLDTNEVRWDEFTEENYPGTIVISEEEDEQTDE